MRKLLVSACLFSLTIALAGCSDSPTTAPGASTETGQENWPDEVKEAEGKMEQIAAKLAKGKTAKTAPKKTRP